MNAALSFFLCEKVDKLVRLFTDSMHGAIPKKYLSALPRSG